MRREFELTDDQLAKLLEASKPQPAMFLSGGIPMFQDQQKRANRAWAELGEELGFDYLTVQMVPGKTDRYFSAEVIGGR